jgi:hypothetical protein
MNNTLDTYTLEDQNFDRMIRLFKRHDMALEVLHSIDDFNCEEDVKHLLRIEWQSKVNQIDRKILKNQSYQRIQYLDLKKFEERFKAASEMLEWSKNWIKFCSYNYGIVPDYNTEEEHSHMNFVHFANENYKCAKASLEAHIQYSIPFTVSQLKDLGF